MSKDKILVTGGAGFIGSHMVEELLNDGQKVVVLDNFSTGKRQNVPNSDRLTLIEGDVQDVEKVKQAMEGVKAIVHLAAVASVAASVDDPVGTHGSNFIGTLNLLEAARQAEVKRFLFASTAAVYGNDQDLPVAEEVKLDPLTPYAADKLCSENYIHFYRQQYGFETAIFRFFNVYGPRQDPSSPYSGVISIFMDRAKAGNGITVFGDGEQTRDFVYVSDLVQVLMKALTVEQPAGGAVNIGTGNETSLNRLIEVIEGLCESSLEKEYTEARSGDVRFSKAAIERLQSRFGITPSTPLQQGLKKLWDYQ